MQTLYSCGRSYQYSVPIYKENKKDVMYVQTLYCCGRSYQYSVPIYSENKKTVE